MKPVKAADGALVERIRGALAGHVTTEQRMFGGTCFMLNGNMVAGTLRGELLVRVGKEANDAALELPHARQMEMHRPALGYVLVSAEGTRTARDLQAWIDRALAHVATLPAKSKKPAAKRPATRKDKLA
ncbi:MAG TPA: TfoX/Sxy family protein [Bauldia sp.]|nr:TfoX/Sxy family protein [Bauldia sp.]